jgi:hypothetical protein
MIDAAIAAKRTLKHQPSTPAKFLPKTTPVLPGDQVRENVGRSV